MPEDVAVEEFTRDEIVEQLEAVAQRLTGLSAAQTLREFVAGRLRETDDLAEVLVLADLLPDDDPVLAGLWPEPAPG
jgi:hypothetical protein